MPEDLLRNFRHNVDTALSVLPLEVQEEVRKSLYSDLKSDIQKVLESYIENFHMDYVLAAVLAQGLTKNTQELRSGSVPLDPRTT